MRGGGVVLATRALRSAKYVREMFRRLCGRYTRSSQIVCTDVRRRGSMRQASMYQTVLQSLSMFLLCATTLFAQGPDPQQSHLPVNRQPNNPELPTLYIVGDSTVRN